MTEIEHPSAEALLRGFEGAEAIYLELGILIVCVTDIEIDESARRVTAKLTELRTPSLKNSLFHKRRPKTSAPLQWSIGAGYLTAISPHTWKMGYGRWSLYIRADLLMSFKSMAATWVTADDPYKRYHQAIQFLDRFGAHEKRIACSAIDGEN